MHEVGTVEGGGLPRPEPNNRLIRVEKLEQGFEIVIIGEDPEEVLEIGQKITLETYEIVFDPNAPPELVRIPPLGSPSYWQIESNGVEALLDALRTNQELPVDDFLTRSSASPFDLSSAATSPQLGANRNRFLITPDPFIERPLPDALDHPEVVESPPLLRQDQEAALLDESALSLEPHSLQPGAARLIQPAFDLDLIEFRIDGSTTTGEESNQIPELVSDDVSLEVMIRRVDDNDDRIGDIVATVEADLAAAASELDALAEMPPLFVAFAAPGLTPGVQLNRQASGRRARHRYSINKFNQVRATYRASPGPLNLDLSPEPLRWNDAQSRFESPKRSQRTNWTLDVRQRDGKATSYKLSINGSLQARNLNAPNP